MALNNLNLQQAHELHNLLSSYHSYPGDRQARRESILRILEDEPMALVPSLDHPHPEAVQIYNDPEAPSNQTSLPPDNPIWESMAEVNYAKAHLLRNLAEIESTQVYFEQQIKRGKSRFEAFIKLYEMEVKWEQTRLTNAMAMLNNEALKDHPEICSKVLQFIVDHLKPDSVAKMEECLAMINRIYCEPTIGGVRAATRAGGGNPEPSASAAGTD